MVSGSRHMPRDGSITNPPPPSLRGEDLNLRPPANDAGELPGCSTPLGGERPDAASLFGD